MSNSTGPYGSTGGIVIFGLNFPVAKFFLSLLIADVIHLPMFGSLLLQIGNETAGIVEEKKKNCAGFVNFFVKLSIT